MGKTLVWIAGLGLGVLGIWIGWSPSSNSELDDPPGVVVSRVLVAASEPTENPSTRSLPTSTATEAIQRTAITDSLGPRSIPGWDGPTKDQEILLQARTATYYLSPPATDAELEILYWSKELCEGRSGIGNALSVAKLRTDAEGVAHITVRLPAKQAGGDWKSGTLYLRTVGSSWLDFADSWNLYRGADNSVSRKIVLHPGISIQVHAEGLAENPDPRSRQRLQLVVHQAGHPNPRRWISFHIPKEDPASLIATWPLTEKGTYRLQVHGPQGAGILEDLVLDPATAPKEIRIRVEEFGTISGKVSAPHGLPDSELQVRAVATHLAEVPDSSGLSPADSRTYPPSIADAHIDPDGIFRITGLTPGTYRLGYHSRIFNRGLSGWFDHPSVATGSQEVELLLPTTLLVPVFVSAEGRRTSVKERPHPGLALWKLPNKDRARISKVESTEDADGNWGYPLYPGNSYHFLSWAKDYPLLEKEVSGPFPPGNLEMEIPTGFVESGLLKWDAVSKALQYQVFSPELQIPMFERRSRAGSLDNPEHLPPGRFLFRAWCESQRGGHGELNSTRTHFGTQEHWVDIRSGQTTAVQVQPPRMGWVEIALTAQGQPDPKWTKPDAFPPLVDVQFSGFTDIWRSASFLMRRMDEDAAPVSLSFKDWYMEVPWLEPGRKSKAAEVFPAGEYALEVRVPGFPLQHHEVTIVPGKWAQVSIHLQGVE